MPMDTENSIRKALGEGYGTSTNGAIIDALTNSICRSMSYDASLKDADQTVILATIRSGGAALEHSAIMAAIRKAIKDAKEFESRKAERQRISQTEETVQWGFLLQCIEAFRKYGDVLSVRQLTVSFLAEWLVKRKQYILDDEISWCAARAVEATEGEKGPDKDNRTSAAYHEAVVMLVMHKFARSLEKNPEKTNALIEGKRKEYEAYCEERFGHKPDWTPSDSTRENPIPNVFKKKTNQTPR